MTTSTVQQDTDNLFSWDTIISTFDDFGALIAKFTLYDNGTTRDAEFESGVLRYEVLADTGTAEAPAGVKTWDRIERTYDAGGNLAETYQLNDNGIQILQNYEAGTLRAKTEVDLGPSGEQSDAAIWEYRETYYDENGVIAERFETRDDGLRILTQYENGVRRYVEQADLGDNGEPSDARVWERIETFYDENGVIAERFRVDDNGLVTITQYEDGTRRAETKADFDGLGNSTDGKNWDQIESIYDENGKLTERFIEYDDGTNKYTEYDAGVRRAETLTDLDDFGNSTDTKSWERIEKTYDANGDISEYFELRDDGTTFFREYQNGEQVFSELLDRDEFGLPTDAKSWDAIRKFFGEDGELQAAETVYDNGDAKALFYEDEILVARYDLDGDNSETWDSREILYNLDGTVAEVNFDVLGDVPGFA